MIIHIVSHGDTLYALSKRYNVSLDTLIHMNGLTTPDELVIGQALVIPTGNINKASLPMIEVNAYYTDFGAKGQNNLTQVAHDLTYASPFSHQATAQGTIRPIETSSLLQIARNHHVVPMLVLTNYAGSMFSSDVGHAILNTPAVQDTLITNALELMHSQGLKGLNIDFEYLYPQDKDAYNVFLRKVAARIHQAGFLLSTALAPKTSAHQQGLLYVAHDYPVHGELCDFVVLMTYEWGWAGGPPWAIAPINEVEKVLNYAVTAIPKHKIMMGVPTYGRDWTLPFVKGKSLAETFDPQVAVERAAKYKVDIQYNTTYQAPFYRYVDAQHRAHEVWFEDARSILAKLDLVKRYGLRGISLWTMPADFPQLWPIIEDNVNVRKLTF
ncbi:glycosyl hydrolase family 18 protein [Ferroacidibacillus organovorans]|uniref:Spore gernimation protein n=1 Tax=Ferroacidibacillus organovorans TaxID=1765683 RepID=A0A117SYQ5_9BACL|nr:glycosyl hydrolase family 18 protein [Ferroacidibacillus organovorans]KUO95409.1 spore gernimation protein [Ferroacidibacillus organovorans]KUO97354.1 spore gernimation protein [Ferroacidibacillus organovorans]